MDFSNLLKFPCIFNKDNGSLYYPLARMRSKGYSSRLVCLSVVRSFVLSVSLLGGSVSVHSSSTRTRIAFIGHENRTKLNS